MPSQEGLLKLETLKVLLNYGTFEERRGNCSIHLRNLSGERAKGWVFQRELEEKGTCPYEPHKTTDRAKNLHSRRQKYLRQDELIDIRAKRNGGPIEYYVAGKWVKKRERLRKKLSKEPWWKEANLPAADFSVYFGKAKPQKTYTTAAYRIKTDKKTFRKLLVHMIKNDAFDDFYNSTYGREYRGDYRALAGKFYQLMIPKNLRRPLTPEDGDVAEQFTFRYHDLFCAYLLGNQQVARDFAEVRDAISGTFGTDTEPLLRMIDMYSFALEAELRTQKQLWKLDRERNRRVAMLKSALLGVLSSLSSRYDDSEKLKRDIARLSRETDQYLRIEPGYL